MKTQRLNFLMLIVICAAVLTVILTSGQTPFARARGSASPNASVPKVDPKVNAKYLNGIQAAKAPAAKKLLPLDASGKYPDGVIPDSIQRRVNGACPENSAIGSVKEDGTVTCQLVSGIIGPEGPTGPQGPSGQPRFYSVTVVSNAGGAQETSKTSYCESGDMATGGGGAPVVGTHGSGFVLTSSMGTESSWTSSYMNTTDAAIGFKVTVNCADTTP